MGSCGGLLHSSWDLVFFYLIMFSKKGIPDIRTFSFSRAELAFFFFSSFEEFVKRHVIVTIIFLKSIHNVIMLSRESSWYRENFQTLLSGIHIGHISPLPIRNRLNEIMKVFSSFDFWLRFICQYQDFKSIVVNHSDPCSLETTSSNVGVTKCDLCMTLSKYFETKHNPTDPFALGIHINEFTRHVGFVTGDIMPCFLRESNSALILSFSDTKTLCGGWTTSGILGFVFIVYSSSRHSIPLYHIHN